FRCRHPAFETFFDSGGIKIFFLSQPCKEWNIVIIPSLKRVQILISFAQFVKERSKVKTFHDAIGDTVYNLYAVTLEYICIRCNVQLISDKITSRNDLGRF